MVKICCICKEEKELTEFHSNGKSGHDSRCKVCKRELARVNRELNYFKMYCITKKAECKRKGLDYNLNPDYLESIWTGVCPIFKCQIERASNGRGSHNSAHLDRVVPSLGYTVGNVNWISGRANRIKYDATIEELEMITDWMKSVTTIESVGDNITE